jgi:type I site-specific restriction endonuclease
MLQLNLPAYDFRVKKMSDKLVIFDSQRKRYVSLSPEEWVRQHFIRFLIEEKGYPGSRIAIEKQLEMNGMKKRCDAILYNDYAAPLLIIELKAPHIPISQATFDQVAVYNAKLNVNFFMISNGLEHYCCQVNSENNRYDYFQEIPTYQQLIETDGRI